MQFRPMLHSGILILVIVSSGCTKEARMRNRAEQGDPKAMYEYGVYLIAEYPRNFYTDYDEGRQWIEKAANKGNKEAMRKTGRIYAMGTTKEAKAKAIQWYLRGAEVGETNSMLVLANAYRFGDLGLEKNEVKAKFWYEQLTKAEEEKTWDPLRRSALAGNVVAMENLGQKYEKASVFDGSKQAFEWYTKAAQAGNKAAMMRLVNAYQHGELGLTKDQGKSDYWFRKWQESMGAK